MPEPIRLMIVHACGFVRHGLRAFFEADSQFEVVGGASTGAHALSMVERQIPDIILLDCNIPDVDTLELCRRIVRLFPETAVLIMTAGGDRELVRACLLAGASNCVIADADVVQLRKAVLQAVQCRAAAPGARKGAPELTPEQPRRPSEASLTIREIEILRLLARGLASHEIATELNLDALSVREQLEEIQRKLNTRSLLEAVLLASGCGLLE